MERPSALIPKTWADSARLPSAARHSASTSPDGNLYQVALPVALSTKTRDSSAVKRMAPPNVQPFHSPFTTTLSVVVSRIHSGPGTTGLAASLRANTEYRPLGDTAGVIPACPFTPAGNGGSSGNLRSSTRLPVFASQVACFASKPRDATRSSPTGASQWTPPGPLCPSNTPPAAPVFASKVRIVPFVPPERTSVFPSLE